MTRDPRAAALSLILAQLQKLVTVKENHEYGDFLGHLGDLIDDLEADDTV